MEKSMAADETLDPLLHQLRVLIKDYRNSRVRHDPGFSYVESLLMGFVREHAGASSAALAEALHSDKSTISRQVAALEAKGYLQRETDPTNRRAHHITLTDEGQRVLATSDELWTKLIRKRLVGWSAADQNLFLELLTRYNTGELAGHPAPTSQPPQ